MSEQEALKVALTTTTPAFTRYPPKSPQTVLHVDPITVKVPPQPRGGLIASWVMASGLGGFIGALVFWWLS